MAIEKTSTLFTYDELSPRAQEEAKHWWLSCREPEDFEHVVDDFAHVAEILGFRLKQRQAHLMGGGTRDEPCVRWRVSHCQLDFAGFDANYAHNKGSVAAIKAYAPKDERLHTIARDLVEAQRKHRFELEATISYSDYYGMEVTDTTVNGRYLYGEGDAEDIVKEAAKSLARWLYDQLRAEDEYQTSDEAIAEAMDANGYTFREDGTREDA